MRFILACVIVLCLGCAAVAPLTEQQVVVLSDAYAKTQGYNLAHYKRPSVHFNYTRADNTWVVFYDSIPDKKAWSPLVMTSPFMLKMVRRRSHLFPADEVTRHV